GLSCLSKLTFGQLRAVPITVRYTLSWRWSVHNSCIIYNFTFQLSSNETLYAVLSKGVMSCLLEMPCSLTWRTRRLSPTASPCGAWDKWASPSKGRMPFCILIPAFPMWLKINWEAGGIGLIHHLLNQTP